MGLRGTRSTRSSYRGLAFFTTWSDADLARLERLAEVVEYEPGDVICPQERLAREFLVVLVGRADLVEGRRRLGSVGPGETIGEQRMLLGAAPQPAVVAQTYVKALYLGPREFHGLLQETTSLGRQLSFVLAARLAATA